MSQSVPVRLIICVDGTWCEPDGAHGNRNHNITNVYRLYTSIHKGECEERSGKRFNQVKKYYRGIAAEDGISYSERLLAGILGGPCIDQIRDVYEYICHTTSDNDEVWLYGFSRGAYVVRAVAGLLHYIRAISSAGMPSFGEDFKLALKVYKKLQQQKQLGEGQIHDMFEARTRPAPIIQFVGVFDTVKAVQDERLYDISLNLSIQHLRHALALNEDRQRFAPEYIYPNFNNRTQRLEKRTFVQAWFIGAHIDIGGSAKMDGLSLYPLQWMLIESQSQGLKLKFDGDFGGRSRLESPLRLTGLEADNEAWECSTNNGLVIRMKDIRHIHQDETSQRRYEVHLHRPRGKLWIRRHREPFGENGELNGYCKFGAQGTIIHPSVYLILDQFMHVSLDSKHFPFYQVLHQWRYNTLGQKDDLRNGCFWNEPGEVVGIEDPGAIRVLVCGNCGVGKSSLINKVFGVTVAAVSHRTRGIHQINDELSWKDRPDLIVHDSGGFEAGGDDELRCVQDFLKKKSSETDLDKRLHVIWYVWWLSKQTHFHFGLLKPEQAAQDKLFKALSTYAQDVPIVAIATKKDQFLGAKWAEERRNLENRNEAVTLEKLDLYAAKEMQDELCQIDEDLKRIGHFDELVTVSKDDDKSIGSLSLATAQLFTHERVRLLYIRAQATRLDLKVDLALAETMKIYRRALISSSSIGAVPGAMATNRTAAAIDVCRTIVTSFGISTITPQTIFEICKANLWDDMGNNIRTTIAEICAVVGLGATVVTGGMPFFLLPMATNIPLVVKATARLVLMLACDVILILTRAFREAAVKSITKPERRDVENAAVAYRQHCHQVHLRVKNALSNVFKCYQTGQVETMMTQTIEKFKCTVLEGVGAPLPHNFRRDYSEKEVSDSDTSDVHSGSSSALAGVSRESKF
ncbi:uncharacterized protein FFUJ_14106 [Fusarium fujikuroi IMI 58289]|uniref:DUF2235 domain-containing protein n=1 Tax=Gibberella fujikuroi (strain CBS 195.34 / IMI 58289 / NRRL A-6831) TaxID=1279085 RepID=S0EMG6_GIBF5|nr:uncharacterized protein FFUJ_14106 [Fusarium fujikuroi IMI 58289]CCT76258.1 uncharacterized protein FFUJ_14106 [Fusarium fujikuroi IMI 58289]SCO26709.1 uncharacterized protein FFM5_14978 [Fusarium fujikuroi]SCO58566.1 uncharacterized protein FFMR_15722 [Fusarium fujikuroi]